MKYQYIDDSKIQPQYQINMVNVNNEIINNEERSYIIMKQLKIKHHDVKHLSILEQLIRRYSNAFYIEGDKFVPTDVYKHHIRLKPNTEVVHIKQFRIPLCDQVEIERQVNNLLQRGIVERSTSPYNSPAFLVKKPPSEDGKQTKRLVHDYRALNKVCYDQYFSLSLIDDVISQLYGYKVFFNIGCGAYNQVLLSEECRELTAFTTVNGHYHYRCLPFGIQSGPVAWNFAANIILGKFLNKNNFCYVDDI